MSAKSRRGRAAFALWPGTTLVFLLASPARAQQGPVFELQPGFTIYDFISVPEGTKTNSAFSVRFSTRFPTSLSWLTPVVGAFFLPYGTAQNTVRNTDAPTLFVGNIFSVFPERKTSGWFTVEVPLLLTHAPGASASGSSDEYGRDLVVLPTVYFHLGPKALRELGAVWSKLNVVVQLEQNLTPNPDAQGHRDFFNPVATIGISLPIGTP